MWENVALHHNNYVLNLCIGPCVYSAMVGCMLSSKVWSFWKSIETQSDVGILNTLLCTIEQYSAGNTTMHNTFPYSIRTKYHTKIDYSILRWKADSIIYHALLTRRLITIYAIILLKSVAVRKLQVAILAQSSREMSQTVRIDWQYILSRVCVSVRPSNFLCGKNTQKL